MPVVMASIRTKHLPLPAIPVLLLVAPFLLHVGLAQTGTCAPTGCQPGLCCSKYGFCGTTDAFCGTDCVSQCPSSPSPPSGGPPSPPSGPGVGSIVTSSFFDQIFPTSNRNSFYTYNSFISATGYFASFGTTKSPHIQKREIAAFFAHIYHETGGLSKVEESPEYRDPTGYCQTQMNGQPDPKYPCEAGKQYFGRGPLQISWNYNYGAAGNALGQPLLASPEIVGLDPITSFKTALWFWTTPQAPKPSCHDVIVGSWTPSAEELAARRTAGFGETINIINGGQECGPSPPAVPDARQKRESRILQYDRICRLLKVDPGSNLDCADAQPYK